MAIVSEVIAENGVNTTLRNPMERKSPFLLDNFAKEKQEYSLSYDFQNWYPLLQKHTFLSHIFPLTTNDAKTIIMLNLKTSALQPIEGDQKEEMNSLIEKLQRNIDILDEIIESQRPARENKRYFLRLSSRSPKDAGFSKFFEERMKQLASRRMKELPFAQFYASVHLPLGDNEKKLQSDGNNNNNDGDDNDQFNDCDVNNVNVIIGSKNSDDNNNIMGRVDDESGGDSEEERLKANYHLTLFYDLMGEILCIKNAEEAVTLLLHSERSLQDLRYELKFANNNKNSNDDGDDGGHRQIESGIINNEGGIPQWDMNFVLREWDNRTNIGYEFRVFVCMGRITAISQYNQYCFYPHLQGKQQEIKSKIMNHHDTIVDVVPYSTYVIDYLVVGDYVRVVELNPFVCFLFFFHNCCGDVNL
jgi:hypothetical protein